MSKSILALICALLVICLTASPVSADTAIGINDLIADGTTYDGTQVTVQGEALGEAMQRGDYSWVNISDGTNAIGIWMETEDARRITDYGNYKQIGDTIEVTGTFYSNCAQHGGDVDIHCTGMRVVSQGHPSSETVSGTKIAVAAILFLLVCALFGIYVRMRKNGASVD